VTNIEAFLDELSSGSPVPGGGSVAALETAMGAALLVMVANLTVGRKRYAEVQAQVVTVRERAEELRRVAQSLIQEDSDAYGRVADALALPRATEAEKTERRQRLQDALKGAVDPPMRTMKVAAEVARLAEQLVEIGNTSAVSDVGSAMLAASAGHEAGRLNVEINMSSIEDKNWAARVRDEVEALPDLVPIQVHVRKRVESIIRGESS